MKYTDLAASARGNIGPYCKACPVCDGRGCKNTVPGPGAKGSGTVAMRNYSAWQGVLLNMDTLHPYFEADSTCTVLGRELSLPVMIAAVQTLIDRLQDEISDLCAWRDSAIAERDFSNERAGMYRRYAESTLAAIGNCQEA